VIRDPCDESLCYSILNSKEFLPMDPIVISGLRLAAGRPGQRCPLVFFLVYAILRDN
jgi:hypothetical protein